MQDIQKRIQIRKTAAAPAAAARTEMACDYGLGIGLNSKTAQTVNRMSNTVRLYRVFSAPPERVFMHLPTRMPREMDGAARLYRACRAL